MANRNFASAGKIYSMITAPVLIDMNFVVDSTNGNGLGIRNLKGPGVANVYMQTSATPAKGNPTVQSTGGAPNSLNLATANNFAILAASAITGSTGGGSTVTGNIGIYPNNSSSITNFPPSTVTGTTHSADAAADQAQIDATAAFTAGQTLGLAGTVIPAELGGTTLTPGNYQSTTSLGLSLTTGHSTLTLNGAGTYNIYSPSTLVTGASGSTDLPVIAFTGGATSSNTSINWIVGSSATINQSTSSIGAVFYGNVIAQASATVTQASTVNGRLIALTAAVTLSNTVALNQPSAGSAPSAGTIIVQLQDNYNRVLKGFKAIVSPVSGTPLTATTASTPVIIVMLGTATLAQWRAVGLPLGITPAVGTSFVPTASATIGGGAAVETASLLGSGISTIETLGDPNTTVAPDPTQNQGFGAQIILQARDYTGALAAPADGTVISLAFLLNNSGNTLAGE